MSVQSYKNKIKFDKLIIKILLEEILQKLLLNWTIL